MVALFIPRTSSSWSSRPPEATKGVGDANKVRDTEGTAIPRNTGPLEFDERVKVFEDPAVDGGANNVNSPSSAIVKNVRSDKQVDVIQLYG